MPQSNSTYSLTGTDCFLLALEKHNISKGISGNTCHYVLDLKGKINSTDFTNKLNQHPSVQWLASISLGKKELLGLPVWEAQSISQLNLTLDTIYSDEILPFEIINRPISPFAKEPLFKFHHIERSNGNSSIVFSWHHLIMDGYGALLFLRSLDGHEINFTNRNRNTKADNKPQIDKASLKKVIKAKYFIDQTSKGPINFVNKERQANVHQKYKVLKFNQTETQNIAETAKQMGVKFGLSTFYLSTFASNVFDLLANRGIKVENFWLPVPKNARRKGAKGPLLGNHLSFLFYRLKAEDFTEIKNGIKSLQEQMMQQMKKDIPAGYQLLMNLLKRIPSSLYYYLISDKKRKSLSSFLFTMAAEHPESFSSFCGHEIIGALTFPPNTYPPGLTFAISPFKKQLQIMILYYEEVVSENEMDTLCNEIQKDLLGLSTAINERN